MTLDKVTVDLTRVAGDHFLWNAVVKLVADQESAVAVLDRNVKTIVTKNLNPRLATAAILVFKDVD